MTALSPRVVGGPEPLSRRLRHLPDAIKIHESLFALPFAYTGMFLAADGLPTLAQFLWITVAMVGARTLGMAANRLIDRHIDARNPRAAGRHLPTGRLRASDMAALALIGLAVLTVAAWRLNTLALALVPAAAAYLTLYPLTKRFTYLANPLLGWALAIAPAAAWIGVRGSLSWEPVVLSVAVAMWAGSFDIIYHAQDFEFHRASGLHSVAGRFGVRRAFTVAGAMDVAASGALLALGVAMGLSWPFYLGWTAAVAGLSYKYALVSPGDMSRMGMAFFRINALVATTVLAGTAAAVFV